MSIYDFTMRDSFGDDIPLSIYKGKVLLIVNTASKCGFTPQFQGLQELYDTYAQQGLEILGFPCNQFAGQDPGSNEEIRNFCQINYGVTFPIFDKIKVNGKNAAPLYQYLKKQKSGALGSRIQWNFTKFLADRQGNVVARYAPDVKPEDLKADIERLL
ncbi:MAG: glutathione peroxidase [Eubacteriales bacterium]|jgi:glutathione peroxidase|nr:glutathione peroxidase [Eubacteriales bacterium]MDD3289878.1 glutathione peroxidase [Eubacteriales bacterium]MDD3863921.1 glutathione peroxidase [Eubacteriales bacterium]MDD4445700.1 glutathione peroxidase [Eubacteriales bacterium]